MAGYVLLARHGSVEPRRRGRFVGSSDVPLGERGRAEAEFLAGLARERKPGRLVSSPLQRAMDTARVVAGRIKVEVEVDEDLREIDFGRWEGKTFDEIQACDPDIAQQWAEGGEDFEFPEGERLAAFFARTRAAVERLARAPEDTVMAVAHGGLVRSALCHLLGLDYGRCLAFAVKPASLTGIRMYDGKGVLEEIVNPPAGGED